MDIKKQIVIDDLQTIVTQLLEIYGDGDPFLRAVLIGMQKIADSASD